jgi:hypothetical protein
MADESQERSHARRDRTSNFVASGLAVFISLTTLALAIRSDRIQERMLEASIWPALEYGTGNRGDEGAAVVTLSVGNSGVGPAKLRTFQLLYGGEPVRNARDLVSRCCALGERQLLTITSSVRTRVLKAGEDLTFLRVPQEGNEADVWERLNQERFKVRALGCYCSVLDNCWILDSDREEPEPVAACPAVPADQQWSG